MGYKFFAPGILVFALLSGSAVAKACDTISGQPPVPPGVAPQAYVAFDAGLQEQQNEHDNCALHDYELAIDQFSDSIPAEHRIDLRRRSQETLTAALSFAGMLYDKRNQRSRAVYAWQRAAETFAALYTYPQAYRTRVGDRLFLQRRFREAFTAYRTAFVPPNAAPQLNATETDSGAADAIRKGLNAAINGNFGAARVAFASSPTSAEASYLEGQAESAMGNYGAAHRAYVTALLEYPTSTSDVPWISDITYASWIRLIALLDA